MNRYESAREQYRAMGVDTEKALEALTEAAVSIHCWQGDDIDGFESKASLSGGIQVTGNHPGKARNPEELMADFDKALSLIPGKHRLNLHAIYAITDEKVDRDKLEPKHFEAWVKYAKERGIGLDFNPTLFAHPMADTGLTLSSPDETIRRFWIDHCKATRKIAAYFGKELGTPCLHNIWIPDGFKEIPADRMGPRRRLFQSTSVSRRTTANLNNLSLAVYATTNKNVLFSLRHKSISPIIIALIIEIHNFFGAKKP